MLYHLDTREEEEGLAKELSSLRAFVLGFGGADDLSLDADGPAEWPRLASASPATVGT